MSRDTDAAWSIINTHIRQEEYFGSPLFTKEKVRHSRRKLADVDDLVPTNALVSLYPQSRAREWHDFLSKNFSEQEMISVKFCFSYLYGLGYQTVGTLRRVSLDQLFRHADMEDSFTSVMAAYVYIVFH